MKQVQYTTFGKPSVLRIVEVDQPQPKPNQVVVRVQYAGLTAADARIRAANFPDGFGIITPFVFGKSKPRKPVLGTTFVGTVEQIGSAVKAFSVGQTVAGMTGLKMGTYSEFITVKQTETMVAVPENIDEAAACAVLFGGTTGLYFVDRVVNVRTGNQVLVNGASGAVGTNLVQLATLRGATVTGVCSGQNAELVRSLGATAVIDYTTTDLFAKDQQYDYIFDAVGNLDIADVADYLKPNGRLVMLVGSLRQLLQAGGQGLWQNITKHARPIAVHGTAPELNEDIKQLFSLLQQGKLQVPIEQVYDMNDVVAAHERLDSKRKVGNNLLRFGR